MTHPQAPTSFSSSPGYNLRHPEPTQVVEERGGYSARALPSPEALLSVAYPNTCTLSKPLLAELGLSHMGSARFHIVAPAQLGGQWYLDTAPKPGVGAALPERGAARFRIQHIPKMHFMQRRPLFAPGGGAPASMRGNANVFVNLLHFRLGKQVVGHPGYYYLERVARAVHQ